MLRMNISPPEHAAMSMMPDIPCAAGPQAALIVDMMRAAGFLEQTGVPGVTLGPKLLVGHSLGGACSVANSATIAGVLGAAVMAPAVRPSLHPRLLLFEQCSW